MELKIIETVDQIKSECLKRQEEYINFLSF